MFWMNKPKKLNFKQTLLGKKRLNYQNKIKKRTFDIKSFMKNN